MDDRVDDGSVRDIILASWTRSREWNIDVDGAELSAFDTESDSLLVRAARPVLDSVTDELRGRARERHPHRRRRGGARAAHRRLALSQALDRIWLAPGFSYSEKFVGTNGIGTALEGRGPAEVFGHEHYVEPLAQFACAGAPVWHPVSGKLLGVIDLTCWRQDAGRFMSTAVARIARQIETALMDQSGPRELALLHDYLTACRRSNMAVFAVSPDLVMSNDRARELIDPADQATLIAGAIEAMNSERRVLLLDLPSGVVARVQVRPSWVDRGAAGGVLQVQLAAPEVPKPRAVSPAPVTALPAAVGSGLLWAKCCQAVDRHFHSREWLVLQGEAGTGKTTIARATHQLRTPAAHLRILNAEDYGPGWVADVAEELATGCGTLVLTHLDQLSDQARQELVDALGALPRVHRARSGLAGRHGGPGGPRSPRRPRRPAGVLPAHGRGAAAAPPRRGRGRAGAALHRTAHPRRRAVLLARGHAAAHAQPVARQHRAALPGAAQDGRAPPRGRARPRRPAARGAGDHPPGAHAAGSDRVRRDRRRAAGQQRQQGRGSAPPGHVPRHDLPQDPRLRHLHADYGLAATSRRSTCITSSGRPTR